MSETSLAAAPPHQNPKVNAQRLLWIVWPAFVVAGVAEAIFFTLFDPFDLQFLGTTLEISRPGVYTLGFFGFWMLGIASSALTVFLEASPFERSRCPLDGPDRPAGCTKREEPDCCG